MLGDVVAQLLNVDITGVQLRLHFEVASRHFLNDESANDALFAWRDPICASSFPWVGEDAEELQRQYLEVKRAYMERALMISESDLRCDYVGVSYKLVMESFEWMARHRADVAVEQHRNLHSHSATYNEETEERVRKAFSNFFDDCRAEMLREFTKYYLLFIQEGFLTNDLVVHEMRRKLNCFMSLPQSVEAEFHRAREVQYTVLADAVEELVTSQQDPGHGAEVAASLRAYKTASTVANKRALEDALSRVHRDIYLIDPMEAPIPAEGTGPCVLCPSYSDEVICATLQRINAFCTEVAETKERSLHYEAPTPGGVESTIITYLQSSVGPIAYTSVVNPIVAPVYHCAAYISCDGCSQVRLFAGVSNQIPTGRLEDFHAVGFASGDLCFACTVQHYRESTRRLWRALHPNPRIQRGFVYGCGTRMKVLKTTVVLEEDGPHVHLSVGFAPLGVRGCVWQLPSSSSPAQQRLWQEEEMPEDLMDPVGTPPPTWANTCRMMHIQHNDGADLSCPICLAPFDGLDPTMRTRCGHVFHVDCIRTFASWRTLGEDAREEFDRNPKLCPMCREENFLPDVNDADAMCEQHNIFHYDLLLDMAAEEAELMIPNDERGKCVRVGVAGLLASDACYHNPTTVFACDVVQILVPHAPTPCS